MTKYNFKQATQRELFITLRPSEDEMNRLCEMLRNGTITPPSITFRNIGNFRKIKTDEENFKIQNIIANCLLLGLSHDDISSNALTVWELVDGKCII